MVIEKSRTSVYLDTNLKEQAKEINRHYDLAQSVFNRGLPFEVKIPNDMTLEAMKDVETGKNYDEVTLEDLKVLSKNKLF